MVFARRGLRSIGSAATGRSVVKSVRAAIFCRGARAGEQRKSAEIMPPLDSLLAIASASRRNL
jgi:hypothetical protein